MLSINQQLYEHKNAPRNTETLAKLSEQTFISYLLLSIYILPYSYTNTKTSENN